MYISILCIIYIYVYVYIIYNIYMYIMYIIYIHITPRLRGIILTRSWRTVWARSTVYADVCRAACWRMLTYADVCRAAWDVAQYSREAGRQYDQVAHRPWHPRRVPYYWHAQSLVQVNYYYIYNYNMCIYDEFHITGMLKVWYGCVYIYTYILLIYLTNIHY